MKLKREIDYITFLSRVKQCRKDVFFDTPEGDHMNLKSVLTQYIFSTVLTNKTLLEQSEIVCVDENDYVYLMDYVEE